ncbi:hypothetical protein B0H19DRAFT_1316882, partial [Mycena capillaripes]
MAWKRPVRIRLESCVSHYQSSFFVLRIWYLARGSRISRIPSISSQVYSAPWRRCGPRVALNACLGACMITTRSACVRSCRGVMGGGVELCRERLVFVRWVARVPRCVRCPCPCLLLSCRVRSNPGARVPIRATRGMDMSMPCDACGFDVRDACVSALIEPALPCSHKLGDQRNLLLLTSRAMARVVFPWVTKSSIIQDAFLRVQKFNDPIEVCSTSPNVIYGCTDILLLQTPAIAPSRPSSLR